MAEADPSPPVADAQPAPTRDRVDWVTELRGLALMLLAVVGFHSLIAKPFYIPSISMMPSLLVGDRLVVAKYPYGWSWVSASFHVFPRESWRVMGRTPERGDIVIVVPPDRDTDYIKRVIGLPGDRLAVVNGQIILNGKPVPQAVEPPLDLPADYHLCDGRPCLEDFANYRVRLPGGRQVYQMPILRETLPNGVSYPIIDHLPDQPLDNYPEIRVPAGHVFLMGDNRDHSADSRAPAGFEQGLGGPVPLADVGGRAEFITFALDGTTAFDPRSWFSSLRPDRAWTNLRPPKAARPDSLRKVGD